MNTPKQKLNLFSMGFHLSDVLSDIVYRELGPLACSLEVRNHLKMGFGENQSTQLLNTLDRSVDAVLQVYCPKVLLSDLNYL